MLLLRTLPFVALNVAAKVLIEQLGWELIDVSPLHTGIVAGAIFSSPSVAIVQVTGREGSEHTAANRSTSAARDGSLFVQSSG